MSTSFAQTPVAAPEINEEELDRLVALLTPVLAPATTEEAQIINEWLTDLESGRYRQGRNALRTPEGFCCLGVLAQGLANNHQDWLRSNNFRIVVDYDISVYDRTSTPGSNAAFTTSGLPVRMAKLLGLHYTSPEIVREITEDDGTCIVVPSELTPGYAHLSLAGLNDAIKMTFPQIAAIIRKMLSL